MKKKNGDFATSIPLLGNYQLKNIIGPVGNFHLFILEKMPFLQETAKILLKRPK
jgi:hypothetical protein